MDKPCIDVRDYDEYHVKGRCKVAVEAAKREKSTLVIMEPPVPETVQM